MLDAGDAGRKLTHTPALLALCVLVAALAPATATTAQSAERSFGRVDPLLPIRVDSHVVMDWEGALGTGGRADIPLISAPDLGYSDRDEIALSLGCDVTFIALDGDSGVRVYPVVAFQWSMSVSERFFFYPEVGLTARIDSAGWNGLSPNLGFGARYYLGRSFGIFGRLGWPMALSGGTVF